MKDGDLIHAFNHITSPDVLHACNLGTDDLKDIIFRILPEIEIYLQQTNGVISWTRLAQFVVGRAGKVQPVSTGTIRNFVISMKDFQYKTTKTLPQCTTKVAKKNRYLWAILFHLFWGGAKLVQQKRQIVLFHTGEKWLMFPVKQICNKCA